MGFFWFNKQRRAKKGQFAFGRKFDGKWYSIYATKKYSNKTEANKAVSNLRSQGYSARVVKSYDYWLVYFRKK